MNWIVLHKMTFIALECNFKFALNIFSLIYDRETQGSINQLHYDAILVVILLAFLMELDPHSYVAIQPHAVWPMHIMVHILWTHHRNQIWLNSVHEQSRGLSLSSHLERYPDVLRCLISSHNNSTWVNVFMTSLWYVMVFWLIPLCALFFFFQMISHVQVQ